MKEKSRKKAACRAGSEKELVFDWNVTGRRDDEKPGKKPDKRGDGGELFDERGRERKIYPLKNGVR